MRNLKHCSRKRSSGQALIESAILIPFMLMIVFNAINFGYFYYVALNMTAATRSGALYSILGPDTPVNLSDFPVAGGASTQNSVAYIVYQDMTGSLPAASSNASVQVCTSPNGVTGAGTASEKTVCTSYGSATFSTPPSDPEAPSFRLHQITISYTFTPLIPGKPFGAVLLATPVCTSSGAITCTFTKKVVMRAM